MEVFFYVTERDSHNPDLLHKFRNEDQALRYVHSKTGIDMDVISYEWTECGSVEDENFVTWEVSSPPQVDYDHTEDK